MTSWSNTDLTPNQLAALQGPAPCDDCPHRTQCTIFELACEDYATYLRSGKALDKNRIPTAAIFDRVHKDYTR